MPRFILNGAGAPEFAALDGFTRGYIEALFFTEEERLCEESGREMPEVAVNIATLESRFIGGDAPGFADLSTCALESIKADCAAFQSANAALLAEAYARDYDEAQAGRDLWFTRNGHGVGYGDREALELEGDADEAYEALTAEMVAAGAHTAAWSAALAKRDAIEAEAIGSRLYKAANAVGGRDAYVGGDGKVYLS